MTIIPLMATPALKYRRYCMPCAQVNPPVAVKAVDYADAHSISISQIGVLVRKRILLAKKVKGLNFVCFNPVLIIQGFTIKDFI